MTVRNITKIQEVPHGPGHGSRYGNPPGYVVTYSCGHSATKPYSGDLQTKAMILRREPAAYLRGRCVECGTIGPEGFRGKQEDA